MSKWLKGSALLLATLLMTSCGHSKGSLKDKAFCSSAAFIDTERHKPIAPTTTNDDEFHQVAGTNVKNQHVVIMAYDNLRECWEYFVEGKKQSRR